MNKHQITGWVRPLMAMLCIALSALVVDASTVFVKSTSGAPYVKVDNGSYQATMQASESGWYYLDVSSGSTITIASSSSGSNASPSISFSSSADSYFVYDTNYGVNITGFKSGNGTFTSYFLFEAPSNWQDASAKTIIWDGNANVELSAVGGNSSSNSVVYLYAQNTSVTGTIYIKRCNPNGGGTWNEAGVTYYKGGYYKSGNDCKPYYDNSTPYSSITWPTKPTWYVKGQWDDASSWGAADAMTNTGGTTWTFTKTLTAGKKSYFLLSYKQLGADDWSPRYHYDSTDKDVSAGGTFNVTAQSGNGTYYIPAASAITGTYTFSFDESTMKLTVTKPVVTTKSATFYIYSTSVPTMSGVTFTTVANDNTDDTKDAMFNWHKGTYSSTTWSGNVSFTANGSTETLTLGTTIADGGTYYFDSSNAETTADYNPFASNVITVYARVSDYANAKLHAWRTTLNNATIDINGTWQADAQLMNDGNETINGYEWYKKTFTGYNEIKAKLSSPESYAIDSEAAFSGTKYIYKVNGTNTVSTTAPAAPVANSLTIHVLNKVQGTTPWLWVYDGADITSAWPGDQMSLTETINGETWHKMTVNTFENTVKAGVMFKTDGNVTWQTPDIQNIDATAGDWYIVVDSWAASKTDNVSCTYSSATVPTSAQQHNSNWYVHGNFAAATATGDAAWSHDNAMTTTDYTVYTWQVNLKSGYNYYFFPSDISSSVWTDINDGHRWAYYNTEQGSTVTGNSTIALNTWVPTRAQSTDANLHYYCESTSLHTIYFNAKTGEVKIVHETIDPTSEKLYLIGLARDNNDPDHVGNEWAANLGIEMTKGTDAYGEYFYATNINLLSFNSGFAFTTNLGSDRDDWTTVNACRYGSIVNSGNQLVLYNENIETDVALANDVYSSTATKWIELYPVGQSQNTFTVETDGAYDIKFYKGDGTTANPPRVKLYRSDFPDAMYIIGGTIGNWSDHKGVKMTRDTKATDEVFTTTTAFDIGATLAFSMRIGNWDLINQHRLGTYSAANGDTGYWITSGDNGNLGTEIALDNYDSSKADWTSGKHNFNIQTNKSGVFNVTVNVTKKWVKFEQIREVQGHTVLVHLEKTDDVTSPQLFAWDKETREDGNTRISVDRPTFTALTTQRKVLTVHENEVYTTTVDGRDWYTWTIDNNIADFIITRGGKALANVTVNGTDTDTDDTDATVIEWRRSGEIFLHWNADGSLVDYTRDYDTYQAQEAPTETKMIDGHYYVYFINTMKWPKSYIYAWFNNPSTNQNEPLVGGYPGKVLTDMVCYDGAGNEVWLFDFGPMSNFEGREPTGLLFSVGDGTGGMQTGDFEFVNGAVYDYSGSVVLGRDLANIIVNGEADGQTRYIVEDDLVAVYYDTNEDMLYCKDLNKFKTTPYVARSVQQDGQLDYVRDVTKRLHGQMAASRYDQSNWVRLKIHAGASYALTNEDLETFAINHNVLKAGTVRGVLTDKINPTMELVNLDNGTAIDTNGTNGYSYEVDPTKGSTINVYTTANFNGSQAGTSGREYFFVTPKPCEYCNVTWAVCTAINDNTATFTVPEAKYMSDNEFDNQGNLQGGFTADITNTRGAESLELGEVYTFQAIIELDESAIQGGSGSGAPRKRANTYAGGTAGSNAYPYVVKPISVGGVVTEVRDLNSDKKVTGVSYVNMAGQTSSKPFEGVNIVVTTYSDGSRSAVKVIR